MQNDKINFIFDEDIKSPEVFLIHGEQKYPRIELSKAIEIAKKNNMNVVLITEGKNGSLPITRIVDKGKYIYDFNKKTKEKNKKLNNVIKTKEIKIQPSIHDNDLSRNANNIVDWCNNNHQVVVKIDLHNDSKKMFSEELRKLGRRFSDDEIIQVRKQIYANNENKLQTIANGLYERLLKFLNERVKILQPLKNGSNLMSSVLFGKK